MFVNSKKLCVFAIEKEKGQSKMGAAINVDISLLEDVQLKMWPVNYFFVLTQKGELYQLMRITFEF